MTAQVRLFRAASVISLAYVFSRVMGYIREAFLAARFGATHTTDAYLVAQDLPTSLFQAASAALVMVFIPVYQRVVLRSGHAAGARLFSLVLNTGLLVAVVLWVVGWAIAPAAIPRLVPGLPEEAQTLATHLTRIMLPMVVFLAFTGVATAVLNANRHFAAPAFVALVSNMCVVGALVLVADPSQIDWVARAAVLGAILGSLIQIPPLMGAGQGYEPVLTLQDTDVGQIARLMLPVLLTMGAGQAQGLVDRFMASGLGEGSISALSYAQRLSTMPYGVVGVAVATVLYPGLAEHAAANRLDELRRTVSDGLRVMAYVLLPMAVGLFVFREPIIQIFFQRGAFDLRAAGVTATALRFLAFGILFFGWMDFLNRSFFALQDAVTPMWAGSMMILSNVLFNVLFVRFFALGGLALGTSLSSALAAGILIWRLRIRVGSLGGRQLLRSVLVGLGTSVIGASAGLALFGWMPGQGLTWQAVRLAVGLGSLVVVHIGLGLVLGNRDGVEMLARLRRRHGVPDDGSAG